MEEHKEKKGSDLEISDWIDYQDPVRLCTTPVFVSLLTAAMVTQDTPQQHNAVDCGMVSVNPPSRAFCALSDPPAVYMRNFRSMLAQRWPTRLQSSQYACMYFVLLVTLQSVSEVCYCDSICDKRWFGR